MVLVLVIQRVGFPALSHVHAAYKPCLMKDLWVCVPIFAVLLNTSPAKMRLKGLLKNVVH